MSTALPLPTGMKQFELCPYCGQSLDKGAAEHLAVALEKTEAERSLVIEQAVARRIAETKATLQTEWEQQLKAEREVHRAQLDDLEADAGRHQQALLEAQSHADELSERLREQEQNHRAASEELAAQRVAEAEQQLRRLLRTEHEADIAEREQSQTRLLNIIDQLKEQNEKLQRDLSNARPRYLGDIDEGRLVDLLSAEFEEDRIDRNGARRGADILHHVEYTTTTAGKKRAGLIVYECKNTKTWLNEYVIQAHKARDSHGAQYAVLVSHAFPRSEERPFFVRDNVIVVEPQRVIAVTTLLRQLMIELDRARSLGEERQSKDHLLHAYISGNEFRHTVEFLYQSRHELEALLEKEQRSHERNWAARKKIYQEIASRVFRVDGQIEAILQGESEP